MRKRYMPVAVLGLLFSIQPLMAETEAKTEEAAPATEQTAEAPKGPTIKPSNNPEHNKQFGDWTKQCEIIVDAEGKETELCQIIQALSNKEDGQPVMKVAIGYVPGKENAVLVMTLPLGIYLPPGVQLNIDDKGKAGRIPINTCLPMGCQAGVELDKEFTERMQKGNQLAVTFGDGEGNPVTAPVSLKGFTAGLKSLK